MYTPVHRQFEIPLMTISTLRPAEPPSPFAPCRWTSPASFFGAFLFRMMVESVAIDRLDWRGCAFSSTKREYASLHPRRVDEVVGVLFALDSNVLFVCQQGIAWATAVTG
jgi:hypothetical protein